jgi:hypothetical protein
MLALQTMSTLIREVLTQLFGELFRRAFSTEEIFGGAFLAFALWCLHYAWREGRTRIHYSVILTLAGAACVTLLVFAVGGSVGSLWRIALTAFVLFFPFLIYTQRTTR